MRTSVLIYDGLTVLDAVGPYEVLRSVPGWEVEFVARSRGEVRSGDGALGLLADRALDEVGEPEILLVPGGRGNRILLDDGEILAWLRRVAATSTWTTSVCTGSLLLGAAGLLDGKRATGHWLQLERLREYGAEPIAERVVEDGKTITAAGVSAGIDMALHLVGVEAGREAAETVQLAIEYDPRPPYDAGSPEKAPAAIVAALRAARAPVPPTAPRRTSAGSAPPASRAGGRRSGGWRGGRTGR